MWGDKLGPGKPALHPLGQITVLEVLFFLMVEGGHRV